MYSKSWTRVLVRRLGGGPRRRRRRALTVDVDLRFDDELVVESYRTIAPKKLIALLD
jgi:hypothetical protein